MGTAERASTAPDQAQPKTNPSETPTVASDDFITLAGAVDRFGVSRATLRRRLRESRLPSAYKAPGPQGEEWYLPIPELRALGYREIEETVEAGQVLDRLTAATPSNEDSSGVQILRQLIELLENERQRVAAFDLALDKASREREEARLHVSALEAELDAERGRRIRSEQLVEGFIVEEQQKRQAARDHLERLLAKKATSTTP